MSEKHHCPECNYSGSTGHAVACHYSKSHGAKLSEEHPEYDTSLSDSTKQKISEVRKEEARNGNHPMQQSETAKKQSQTLREKAKNNDLPCQQSWNRKRQSRLATELNSDPKSSFGGTNQKMERRIENESWGLQNSERHSKAVKANRSHNGHHLQEFDITVASLWEKQFAYLLNEHNHEFTYEPCFELKSRKYYPDFQVGDTVFELKGYIWEDGIEKANQFLELYPSHTYIVIGKKMPADHHYPWENRKQCLERL
jgi:hypothetical protein